MVKGATTVVDEEPDTQVSRNVYSPNYEGRHRLGGKFP